MTTSRSDCKQHLRRRLREGNDAQECHHHGHRPPSIKKLSPGPTNDHLTETRDRFGHSNNLQHHIPSVQSCLSGRKYSSTMPQGGGRPRAPTSPVTTPVKEQGFRPELYALTISGHGKEPGCSKSSDIEPQLRSNSMAVSQTKRKGMKPMTTSP